MRIACHAGCSRRTHILPAVRSRLRSAAIHRQSRASARRAWQRPGVALVLVRLLCCLGPASSRRMRCAHDLVRSSRDFKKGRDRDPDQEGSHSCRDYWRLVAWAAEQVRNLAGANVSDRGQGLGASSVLSAGQSLVTLAAACGEKCAPNTCRNSPSPPAADVDQGLTDSGRRQA